MGFDVNAALEAGYSKEEIEAFTKSKDIKVEMPEVEDKPTTSSTMPSSSITTNTTKPQVVEPTMGEKLNKYSWRQEQMAEIENEAIEDTADLYKNINQKYSTGAKSILGWLTPNTSKEGTGGGSPLGAISSSVGYALKSDEARMDARRDINKLNAGMITKLQKEGFDAYLHPETGEPMYRNSSTGEELPIDSSILNDLWNSKFETGGAIAGAMAGASAANAASAAIVPITPPTAFAKTAIVGAGAIAGGMTGAASGRALDMMHNSLRLRDELETELIISQMKEAAIYDGITGIVGAGVWKTGGYAIKGIKRAADFIAGGNKKGAEEALKRIMGLSDEQITDIISLVEKQSGSPISTVDGKPLSEADKKIAAVALTQQGTEQLVGQAVSEVPDVANQLKRTIDLRAKEVIKLTDTVGDANVGKLMKEQLATYKDDVKLFYREVKDQGASAIDPTNYRFDAERLALKPVMDSVRKTIGDSPNKTEQLATYLAKIEDTTQGRTFSDLVDLRQAMNDFKHTKLVSNTIKVKGKQSEFDAVNEVINRIDTQIEKAVKTHMPEGEAVKWLENFKQSKTEYAKMKQLENNVLFRVINRKGISEEAIQKGLSKYIDSLDDTFLEVMDKLPPGTRMKAEGAIIKHHLDKYTLGYGTDQQAIHFPMLSDTLKKVDIKTPEAKYLRETIDGLAKVFKNDINLTKISGNIAAPKNPSYLSNSLTGRAEMAVISGFWKFLKKRVPTHKAHNTALIDRMEKVLANPMHVKTADDFIRSMPKESHDEMRSLVGQLRLDRAANPVTMPSNMQYMYQANTPKLRYTNGEFGKGAYLVTEIANPKNVSLASRQLVDKSKLASMDTIYDILDKEVTAKEIRDNPKIQQVLVDKGFLGINANGKVMLFPDNVMGSKKAVKPRSVATLDDVSNIMDKPISADDITPEIKAKAKEKGFKGIEVNGSILNLED